MHHKLVGQGSCYSPSSTCTKVLAFKVVEFGNYLPNLSNEELSYVKTGFTSRVLSLSCTFVYIGVFRLTSRAQFGATAS